MIGGAVLAVALAILVGALLLADLPPGAPLGRSVAAHVSLALVGATLVCATAVGAPLTWLSAVLLGATIALGIRLYGKVSRVQSAAVSPTLLVIHGAAAAVAIGLVILQGVSG